MPKTVRARMGGGKRSHSEEVKRVRQLRAAQKRAERQARRAARRKGTT